MAAVRSVALATRTVRASTNPGPSPLRLPKIAATQDDPISCALRTCVHPLLLRLRIEDEWACVQVITMRGSYGDWELTCKKHYIDYDANVERDADIYMFVGKFSVMDHRLASQDAKLRGAKDHHQLPDHRPSSKAATAAANVFPEKGVKATPTNTHWSVGWITRGKLQQVRKTIGGYESNTYRVVVAELETVALLSQKHPALYLGPRAHTSYTGFANDAIQTGAMGLDEVHTHVCLYMQLVKWWLAHARHLPASQPVVLTALPPELLPLVVLSTERHVRADFIGWHLLRATANDLRNDAHREIWLGSLRDHADPSSFVAGELARFAVWLLRTRLRTCLRHLQQPLVDALKPRGVVLARDLQREMLSPASKRLGSWALFKRCMYPEEMEQADYLRRLSATREADTKSDPDNDKGFMPPGDHVFVRVPFEMRLRAVQKRHQARRSAAAAAAERNAPHGRRWSMFMWQGNMIEWYGENTELDLQHVVEDIVHPQMTRLLQQSIAKRLARREAASPRELEQSKWWVSPILTALKEMRAEGRLRPGVAPTKESMAQQDADGVRYVAEGAEWAKVVSSMPGCIRALHKRHIPQKYRFWYYSYMMNNGTSAHELLLRMQPWYTEHWRGLGKNDLAIKHEWTLVAKDVERVYEKGLWRQPESKQVSCHTMSAPEHSLCPFVKMDVWSAQRKCASMINLPDLRFRGPVDRSVARRKIASSQSALHPIFHNKTA